MSKLAKMLILAVAALAVLAACGGGADPVQETAQAKMEADGVGDAAIVDVVEGDPSVRGAEELYCVATDATTSDLPYLLVVYNTGEEWQAEQMFEGFYEWDLNGCPR